jgi:acyl-CoA thioester hydrolase
MPEFRKTFHIRWADLDPNWHLRHSAYADYCTQARFACLAENGFPVTRFAELGFAPVSFREETRYFKEVRMNESIEVVVSVETLGSRGEWTIGHQVLRGDGQLAAKHVNEGAWLDVKTRKLTSAPEELLQVLRSLQS